MNDQTTVVLTGVSLVLGFLAALLLAFFPPQVTRYDPKDGSPIAHLLLESKGTAWSKFRAKCDWWLSYSGPALLAVAFALQFVVFLRS